MRFALVTVSLLAVVSACSPSSSPNDRTASGPERDIIGGGGGSAVPTRSTGGGVRVASTSNGAVCGDDLAATTFRFAICACEDAAFAAAVETSSFSSSNPSAPVAGGGLGANGDIAFAGELDVGGTLAAGGSIRPAGAINVRDDLRAGGDFTFAGAGEIGGDAFLGGDLTAFGLLIGGTVHANEDARILGVGVIDVDIVREPVTVDPPCACGDDERTDVTGIVEAARTENDNAALGTNAAALTNVAGDIELSLAPGRHFFDGVRAAGIVAIEVTGPTAMYVDGDVAFAGVFEVLVSGDEASLDLFINGDLATAGTLDIGSATSPSKVRVYVGGTGDIAIAGAASLGASLFAPQARVALAGDFTFDGALVAGSLAQAGVLRVRYDADILDGAGLGCEPDDVVGGDDDVTTPDDTGANGDDTGANGDDAAPGDDVGTGTCDTSADCGNQACVDGTCGACVATLDCAAPLVCAGGECIPLSG